MSFSMAAATILATDPTPICTTTEPGLIGTITDWLIMLMETIGGIGVALAIALESIFPPIPSEVISRWVGLHRINLAADKIPGVSRKDVSKANDWFTKYGTWSVLIGRVIPVVRSLISIPAGFNRMNFLHFTGCGTPSSFPPVTCSATSGARFKARSACSRTWSSRP